MPQHEYDESNKLPERGSNPLHPLKQELADVEPGQEKDHDLAGEQKESGEEKVSESDETMSE